MIQMAEELGDFIEASGLLEYDPKAIEEAARDGLGLMREGELLILLHDGPGVSDR